MDVFSDQAFWKNYGSTPDYQERLLEIANLCPDESASLLDIGCGDGAILNGLDHLRPNLSLYGVDTFLQHTSPIMFPYIQASLPLLPFINVFFDIVICLEVLEHINEVDESILEIQRLAKNQIIIGVPYRENLQSLICICNVCKFQVHAYGHLRSYTENDMVDLFPNFRMNKLILTGVKQRRMSQFGIQLEHRLANSFYQPDHFICPHCGSQNPEPKKKPVVIYPLVHSLNRFLTMFSSKLPYWMIASYTRK